jgi:O-antigen ligase
MIIKNKFSISKALVYLFFYELFLGGSGRIFTIPGTSQYGGITLRMIIFVLLIILLIKDIIFSKDKIVLDKTAGAVILVMSWILVSALLGFAADHDPVIIRGDVTPTIFIMVFFPLRHFVSKYEITFEQVYKVLLKSVLVLSVAILLLTLYLKIAFGGNVYMLQQVLDSILEPGSFQFRQEGGNIFYPGLMFALLLNLIVFHNFFYSKTNLIEKLTYMLSFLVIVFSATKGLLYFLLLGHFILIALGQSRKKSRVIIGIMSVFLLLNTFVDSPVDLKRLVDSASSKDEGVAYRLSTFDSSIKVFEESPSSLIMGNGYGTELPERPEHQENSYLDILVEQGIIGLVIYLGLFIAIFNKFSSYKNTLLSGLFVGVLAIAFMSLTNPYINNPLGIGAIVLCLIFKDKHSNGIKRTIPESIAA